LHDAGAVTARQRSSCARIYEALLLFVLILLLVDVSLFFLASLL
jgi:hypothetical protein